MKQGKATGDCFKVAVQLMYQFHNEKPLLVHGLVKGYPSGIIHPHAWIEVNGKVYDYSNGGKIELDKQQYYSMCVQTDSCITYSFYEMNQQMLKHSTYGPWDKNLLEYGEE